MVHVHVYSFRQNARGDQQLLFLHGVFFFSKVPEDVAIQHEGTAVIRPITITGTVTTEEAINMFVEATTPKKSDPSNEWTLFEVCFE